MLADYLVSRAQAALDTVSGLEKGYTQYLASSEGEFSWRCCVEFLQLELPGVGLSRNRVATQSRVPVHCLTLLSAGGGGSRGPGVT